MASSQAEEGGSSLPPLPPLPLEAPAIDSNVSNDSKLIPTKHTSFDDDLLCLYPAIPARLYDEEIDTQNIIYQE